jgi:serine/threonine-protein kinase
VLSDVGKAVTRAHEVGIVHRDLKPANVFVSREGGEQVVRVLDFGIAKDLSSALKTLSPDTRTGTLLGTPQYISPEQIAGKKSIHAQADIWALSVMAFECIVGQRPFQAETLGQLILAICKDPIPLPSSLAAVPRGFDEWFGRGTRRDPAERFPSVKLQMAALRAVCGVKVSQPSALPAIPEEEAEQTLLRAEGDGDAFSGGPDTEQTLLKAEGDGDASPEEPDTEQTLLRAEGGGGALAAVPEEEEAEQTVLGAHPDCVATFAAPEPDTEQTLRRADADVPTGSRLSGVTAPGVRVADESTVRRRSLRTVVVVGSILALVGVAAAAWLAWAERPPLARPAANGPAVKAGQDAISEAAPASRKRKPKAEPDPTTNTQKPAQPEPSARSATSAPIKVAARRVDKGKRRSSPSEAPAPVAEPVTQQVPAPAVGDAPIPSAGDAAISNARKMDRTNSFAPPRRALDQSNPFGR